MSRILVGSAVHLLSFTSISFATRSFFHSPVSAICQRMSYTIEEHGSKYAENYRVFFRDESGIISPFHDIPLLADKESDIFNMVVEVPRWSNAKMEIATKELMNPIKQDFKKGKLRFVKNVFPYKGYPWNYGAIPQTWEDPCEHDELTGLKGDGDPIDVLDIGNKVARIGEVKQVKLLGIMALIDEGETDWKVIAIDVNDPLASKLNDIDDVRKTMPGLIEATHEWFKTYKIPAGSHPNHFAFNGEAKDRKFTTDVVMEMHKHWKKLICKEIEQHLHKLTCETVSMDCSPYKISRETANNATKELPPSTKASDIPIVVDTVYFLTEQQKNGE